MSDQARPPRMRFPKIEGSPLLSNDEAQALRAVLLGLDPMDTSGNPPSLDIWLAARDFYRSPEAVGGVEGEWRRYGVRLRVALERIGDISKDPTTLAIVKEAIYASEKEKR